MKASFYRRFSVFLAEQFGSKVYRICIDAGFSCPNRDGTLSREGCAYCAPGGSWRTGEAGSIAEQVRREKERVKRRYRAEKFLAYFQPYTNTYAPADVLRSMYDAAGLGENGIVGIIIGTRPDCIDQERLELISSYRKRGLFVMVEYGLQSANDRTLELIGRGHTSQSFAEAVHMTKQYGIMVGAHIIIGLPKETKKDMRHTARFLSHLPVDLLKIHNLNIVEGSRMALWYRERKVAPLSLDEYAELAVDFLERTDPEVTIDRLVAESDPAVLIEPRWSLEKQHAIGRINECFRTRGSCQGILYNGAGGHSKPREEEV
jgi:radical SAM protein (TIGR01212 family)